MLVYNEILELFGLKMFFSFLIGCIRLYKFLLINIYILSVKIVDVKG